MASLKWCPGINDLYNVLYTVWDLKFDEMYDLKKLAWAKVVGNLSGACLPSLGIRFCPSNSSTLGG